VNDVDQDALPPSVEGEWDRLRRQFELSTQSWVGFIFISSPRVAHAIRHRLDRLIRQWAGFLAVVEAHEPEELAEATTQLLGAETARAMCLWLEAIHADPPDADQTGANRWARAVDDLFLRLNERRDTLLEHVRGGFLAVLTPPAKERIRLVAPDIWSIRRLVLEPPPLTPDEPPNITSSSERMPPEQSIRRVLINVQYSPDAADSELALLLAQVDQALNSDRSGEAVLTARDAVQWIDDHSSAPTDRAVTLAFLSRAEEADGDLVAGLEHAEQALRVDATLDNELRFELLDRIGRTAASFVDLPTAIGAYEESLALRRQLRQSVGEIPQALRDLSFSLDRVGDVRREAGDLAAAAAAFEESLALDRQLRQSVGETPQALRDLSVSLEKLANVWRLQENLAGAEVLDAEAADVAMQLSRVEGTEPDDSPR
jgi:tetratricopeptide (TPR) repeat protein